MRTYLFVLVFMASAIMPNFLSGQDSTDKISVELDTVVNDSIEYELIVTELGYESYLVTQPPMNFYTESYYKNWNHRYAIEWNIRYRTGPNQYLYENEIWYDFTTNYGIELEYKLYYFFRYFEKKYNVKLVPRGK